MDNIRKVVISGEFNIFTAQAVRAQLLTALDEGRETEVDLSRVSEIDSAGIQIMVAAKREATARGQALRFTGHSQVVLEILDLCDLSSYFGDPLLIPAAGKESAA